MRAAFAAAALLLAALLPPLAASASVVAACATGVDASSEGDGSIRVRWNPVDGASRYHVHRAVGPAGSFSLLTTVDAGGATSLQDDGTSPGLIYRYAVTTTEAASPSSCGEASTRAVAYAHGLATALGIAFLAATGYALVRARA